MTPKRVRKGEFFDSACRPATDFGTPAAAPQSRTDPPPDSSVEIAVDDEVVAVAIDSTSLRARVLSTLQARRSIGGPDLVSVAPIVVIDSPGDVTQRVSDVRKVARPDAALIVVLDRSDVAVVAAAHAAGAFACVRPPIVAEELLSFVTSALDSRAAKVHAADLARKVDLEAHLVSIGRMCAGLAHEIGNPLGAAILNVEAVRVEVESLLAECGRSMEAMPELKGALQDTAAAHARLKALLGAVRGLVRTERSPDVARVDVLNLMGQVRNWLEPDLRGVDVEVLGVPLEARVDPTILGQILHNLVANAAHAARSFPSPRIRLHVYQSADRVIASVRDNGPGIPAELHSKIFEPFFTTRRGKGGTGLGLALCLEYAARIGADLSFWSLPGRGTCFRVAVRA